MRKILYLLRHGEPEEGYTGKYLGRLDPELSPRGIEQARHIAKRIAPLAPARCLTSPLRRAAGTADIAAAACGLTAEPNYLLLEINFGKLEGMTFKEARALYPDVADSWRALSGDFSFPEGENYAAFQKRVAELAALARREPVEKLLMVAHGGLLRGLVCNLLDIPANGPLRFRLAYASLTTLELDEEGPAVLTGFNVGAESQ